MAAAQTAAIAVPAPLQGPFATPPSPSALRPSTATKNLVSSQVQALLSATPSYHSLPEEERRQLAENLVNVSAYAAECVREMCWQSEKLGQVPVVRKREVVQLPAVAQARNFEPRAANQIARITQETLRAIAFPAFVADLIRSTFNAIVQTSIQQMESFVQLLANVSKTVDQFMGDNISDAQARDWLAQSFPEHIQVRDGRATVREGAEERAAPNFRSTLKLQSDVSLDESSIEETLVPAARRRLAESRLQILSTLVLMGVNRIVITGGKIRATMGFHIDTTDRAREEHATDFDFRTAAQAQLGFGPWSASASMSVAYVSSTRASSDSEINVETDLTGEVELHFKSDYFPVERFANQGTLGAIQNNTAVPEANAPPAASNPLGSGVPTAGGSVGRFQSQRTRRSAPAPSATRPIGTLPEAPRAPDAPAPVQPRPQPPASEPQPAATPPPAAGQLPGANQQPSAGQQPAPETPQDGAGGANEGGQDQETPAATTAWEGMYR